MKHVYAPGEYMHGYKLLREAFGAEFNQLSNPDAALVCRDFMDGEQDEDLTASEYRRRIGTGNLQSYAEVMRVRAAKGW